MALRSHLLARETEFSYTFRRGDSWYSSEDMENSALACLKAAYSVRLTFVHNDYDYLWQNIRQVHVHAPGTSAWMEVHYQVVYLTTCEQEEMIQRKLEEIIRVSGVEYKPHNFLMIRFVYDYISSTMEYDNTRMLSGIQNKVITLITFLINIAR